MNYEEKYKQALERAKYALTTDMDNSGHWAVNYIFPELKESEDERIKREILELVSIAGNGNQFEEIKDWLEKQGEKLDKDELVKSALRMVAISFMNWLDANTPEDKMCLSNMECEDIENAIYNEDWNKMAAYIKKKLENQQGKCADCTKYKGCVTCVDGNMKETTKPRFKVGDWVILYDTVAKILDEEKYGFAGLDIDGKDFFCNYWHTDSMHLWTIQDAKNGDVLAEDSCIFIIQKMNDNNTAAKTYCVLHDDGDFTDGSTLYFDIDTTKPATKEQRDLLFAKMKEAGYEWDADKKELKKI